MDNLIYILFICIVIPLALMTVIVEKNAKRPILFVIIGCFIAVFAAEVNAILASIMPLDIDDFTVRVSPIIEEVVKAVPVLFFATVISDKREEIFTISIAVGIGFAVLENTYILLQSTSAASILWAAMRGFGTGLMHGMCTLLVGFGFTFIRKRRKLFIIGTFDLLAVSITYHAIFNMLVQSDFRYVGALIPIITYLPFFIWRHRNKILGGKKV